MTKLKFATVAMLLIAAHSGGPNEVSRAKGDEYVEAVKKDLQLLQGTWEIQSFAIPAGKMDLPADKKLRTLTIDGTKATLRVGKQEIVMTWLIDPGQKPKRLTFATSIASPRGRWWWGALAGKSAPRSTNSKATP